MNAKSYLKENIDNNVVIKPWHEQNKIPVFLKNIYKFYEIIILDTPCILLEILDETPGVDTIQKHIKRIEELTKQQFIIFYKDNTRYRRKSLIEKHIPFVIENGQMYLPFLGLDLKRASQYVEKEISTFSSATQKGYLYFLYNENTMVNTTEFAEKLNLTVMTASRVLNDLYDAKLLTYEIGGKTGRSKVYQRVRGPEYFEKGRSFIKSPVKKVVYVKRAPEETMIAGLEALAELSMINPPGYLVRAISRQQFKESGFEIINNKDIIKDKKLVELQIWDYDPKEFTDKKLVDNMSLYASLKEVNDERVEQAIEEVLRGEKWYTD